MTEQSGEGVHRLRCAVPGTARWDSCLGNADRSCWTASFLFPRTPRGGRHPQEVVTAGLESGAWSAAVERYSASLSTRPTSEKARAGEPSPQRDGPSAIDSLDSTVEIACAARQCFVTMSESGCCCESMRLGRAGCLLRFCHSRRAFAVMRDTSMERNIDVRRGGFAIDEGSPIRLPRG